MTLRIATEFSGSGLKPIVNLFSRRTGIDCEFVTVGKDPDTWLGNALDNNCDLFVTSVSDDLERAHRAGAMLYLAEHIDEMANVPERFKSRTGFWTGYAYRVRALYYHCRALMLMDSYLDLAHPMYKGMVASRKMDHKYNHAFVAYLIEKHGADVVEQWMRGLETNGAFISPELGDKEQAKMVIMEIAEVAICNSYYLSELLHDPKTRAGAATLRIHYPHQNDTGAFALVNGVGVLNKSRRMGEALEFVRYLLSDEVQLIIGSLVTQYPVTQTVNNADCIGGILKTYGANKGAASYAPPKIDPIDVFTTVSRTDEARLLIRKVFS